MCAPCAFLLSITVKRIRVRDLCVCVRFVSLY